jgi:hypothetical protein
MKKGGEKGTRPRGRVLVEDGYTNFNSTAKTRTDDIDHVEARQSSIYSFLQWN